MELKDNIYNLRKSKKISQEDLAEKVEVTRQTISNWELGSTSPNPKQLILLSKALCVSVDELLGNEITQNNNLAEREMDSKENRTTVIKSNKFAIFILFIDILMSFIWGIASIVCLTENMIIMATVDLVLCIVWGLISIIWHYKKIK